MSGLDSAECRAGEHKACTGDNGAIMCLCHCHPRVSMLKVEMMIRDRVKKP